MLPRPFRRADLSSEPVAMRDTSSIVWVRHFPLLMGAGFLLPLLVMHGMGYGWFPLASDDAYIYLGYVKILLEHGDLFSYNPGEHSAGTTGLLYYYLLSLAGGLALPLLSLGDGMGKGLTLLSWGVNALLFLTMTFTLVRVWRHLLPAPPGESLPWQALLLATTALHPLFFWGWFGGLENPLTGALVLLLLERALAGAPPWQGTLVAAALACCRPELFPVALLATLLLTLEQGLPLLSRRLPLTLLLFAGTVALLVLPCWLLTGEIFPSAMGARVTLPPLSDPAAWWKGVVRLVTDGAYLGNPWVWGSALLGLGMLPLSGGRPGRILAWVALLMAFNYLLRGFLGLTHFNVHDRYISYLWPLYAILILYGTQWSFHALGGEMKGLLAHTMLGVGVAGWLAAPWVGYPELRRDVEEMNQVHVEPARWMAAHLPPDSRISMEPAGAIRLFTPFYLVDGVGLTTRHLPDYLASSPRPPVWEEFLQRNRVTHVFDYPGRIPMLRQVRHFRPLKFWQPQPQRFSLGTIGLYQVLE